MARRSANTETLSACFTHQEAGELKAAARENDRSMSGEIRHRLGLGQIGERRHEGRNPACSAPGPCSASIAVQSPAPLCWRCYRGRLARA